MTYEATVLRKRVFDTDRLKKETIKAIHDKKKAQ